MDQLPLRKVAACMEVPVLNSTVNSAGVSRALEQTARHVVAPVGRQGQGEINGRATVRIRVEDTAMVEHFECGQAAVERGDYPTALRQFLPLADQGHADAQFNLGCMYREGQDVLIDYAEAMKWFRLAADQGHGRAQTTVGCMYREGRGVPRDWAEAVRWYRLAAEQRESYAQANLGSVYFYGEGASQDRVLAYMWSHLAATQDQVAGAENRDLFGKEMTRDQITEAKRLAREWKPKSERQ